MSWPARAWVRSRSAHYHAKGLPISPADLDWLVPFHAPHLLADVRICRAPLRLSRFAGMTYGAAILISPDAPSEGAAWRRLIFHELVHVVQYDILDIDAFIDMYLREWAEGGYRYRAIGLEEDAYAIESLYTAGPLQPFSVRAEVERRLAERGER